MGERLSGDGRPGRRRAQPGAVSDAPDTADATTLETELAAVLRTGDADPRAEQRAVAAFRDARAAGAHQARTRRRDDWRPAAERRARRPLKMTFGAVFASLALGGVAVAAIGSAGSSGGTGAGPRTGHPSAVAPARPGGAPAPSDGSRSADRPPSTKDTEAHCRAYEQIQGRGKALDATAWQRLVTAAGGKDEVAAYCSEQLKRATATASKTAGKGNTGNSGNTGKSGEGAGHTRSGTTGRTGGSGNGTTSGRTGTSGGTSAGGGDSGGNGRAGGGKSGGKH
ncbi:hypothetical protein [Streptomyces puniciscabiei]|uniref:hypothetical protein n=1 Tax=Streptomyces puniciscabiei TaxID=164348 RepID=UPI003EBC7F03